MSCCESSCGGCQKSCSSCSPALYLTEAELKLLRRFGETPFLPVARRPDGETPVCLEEGTGEQETVSNGILALERKGLIDLDYNLPLQNFDYGPYAAWSRQGPDRAGAGGLRYFGHPGRGERGRGMNRTSKFDKEATRI